DDDQDSFHSLDDYTGRMVDGQNEIYYIIADDIHSARRSPHLDAFRQRGIEVLYFTDAVDAMLPMGLTEYKGYTLRAVDESDIDLTDVGEAPEAPEEQEPLETDTFESLVDRVKAVLGDRVSGVRQSEKLVGSPARLVSEGNDQNRHMFRINRLVGREYNLPVKTLELNPRHPLLHNISNMLANNGDNPLIDVVIEQVFETALLQDGIHPDPASMAQRITALMQAATGGAVDFNALAPEKSAEE
ncbi:MAG: hypothetical protein KC496_12720, partial [Anaerolineae bacterium]|nr:hypothetical protein [Anaerolineae bacterium]